MTSRDFGYLTLRNTRSYNLDDTYVAANYVFTVSSYGAPKWTNSLVLNNLVTSSIETSSIKISSLIDRDGGTGAAGDVLHTDGSTAYWAPVGSGSGYWSENGNDIFNNNTGLVTINSTLVITQSGLVNANSTLYASTLSTNFISMTGASSYISTANILAINASSIYYTPKDPTYIDAFKIELSGANFLVNRSTLGNISTTMLLNTGSGALSLGTNNPYLFIRGTNSGGNTGNVGIFTSTPQFTLEVAGNAHISSFISTNTINMNNGLINSVNGLLVNGIRQEDTTSTLYYNPGTSEITYGTLPSGGTNYWSLNGSSIYNNNDSGNGSVGIGTSNPQAYLHVSEASTYNEYTAAGTYTFIIPADATVLEFEMIGAGGPTDGGTAGTGGYIKGTMNVTSFQGQTITIIVGAIGDINPEIPAGATYIYIPTTGPLFVMAGAGGSGSGAAGSQYGGWGGGGSFTNTSGTNWVAAGGDGETSGGGVGGQGGQTGSGGAGGSCSGLGGQSGQGPQGNYEQALGGTGNGLVPGGSGYTGGGEGCGAGGGSSYYNSAYTTIITSYAGNAVPAGLLTGYGRTYQNGYVSISILSSEPAIVTNGAVGIGTLNPLTLLDVRGDTSITGNLNVSGYAISKVATSTITTQSSFVTSSLFGKYIFVNGDYVSTLFLPDNTGGSSEGDVVVLRNYASTTSLSIYSTAVTNPTIITATKTTSFVYTTLASPSGWYSL